jgi:hypothetical protein
MGGKRDVLLFNTCHKRIKTMNTPKVYNLSNIARPEKMLSYYLSDSNSAVQDIRDKCTSNDNTESTQCAP